MTVIEFVGNALDFRNYFLRYFQGKTLEYYNLQSTNWYGILENLGYGIKINPIYEDKDFLELGMTIYTNYFQKWEHLAALFLKEYNPIENYSMTEDMLDYTEHGKTDEHYENYSDETSGHSVSGANVRNGKIVTAVSADSAGGNITVEAGENNTSAEYVTTMDDTATERLRNKNKVDGTTANDVQNAFYNYNEKNGHKYIDELKTGKNITDNITNIELQPNSISGHKGTRSGNIGVTTTQQMAMSEIDYAHYIQLAKIICSDVIDFISAGVYECDC